MYFTSMFWQDRSDLTDNPAVPALQRRGGTGDGTVGAVLVAGLARHGRGEGGAGAACRGGRSAAGQGGARADPLVLALAQTHKRAFLKSFVRVLLDSLTGIGMGINVQCLNFQCVTHTQKENVTSILQFSKHW